MRADTKRNTKATGHQGPDVTGSVKKKSLKNQKDMDDQTIQQIIDILTYVFTAAIGWFARWLAKGKQEQKILSDNKTMKEIILQYDTAAKEALRSARKTKLD